MFAALGRATVRFRWLVVAAWVIITVALVASLPTLSSVEKSSNSDFLPATAASVRANILDAPFGSKDVSQAVLIAAAPTGSLTAADNVTVARVEQAIRGVPRVIGVTDQGASSNGRARKATVELRLPARDKGAASTRVVDAIRSSFASVPPSSGLSIHLTGPVAQSVDRQSQTSTTQTLTELLSVLFIIVLLLLTFRALLAPLVALLPSAVALVAAGPLIAESTRLGVQVSDLTPILLTVLLLGAGTDYGLFLICLLYTSDAADE